MILDNIYMGKLLPPTTKLGQGNIFRSMCQEFCSWGGGGNPACIASLQANTQGEVEGSGLGGLQAHIQGEVEGSGLGSFQAPHPGGKLRGLTWGVSRPIPRGLQAHTWGVSQHALRQTPPSRHLMLQMVRILLECILVT